MKTCKSCGRKSITQNLVWEHGRSVLKDQCCNPKCATYKPFVSWTREPAANIIGLFEDLLDKHGIDIPSKERDAATKGMTKEEIKKAGFAHIYGEEYCKLEDAVVKVLEKMEEK